MNLPRRPSFLVSNSTRVCICSRCQSLNQINVSADREVMRKKYIMSLENRSQDQIAEEEALYVEVKRLEQNERRFKRDREALLRILAGIDSGLPDIQEDDGVPLGITGDPTAIRKNKKKGGQTTDLESPATPSVPSVPTGGKRPHTTKNAAYGWSDTTTALLFYSFNFYCRLTALYHANGSPNFWCCHEGRAPAGLFTVLQAAYAKGCHCSKDISVPGRTRNNTHPSRHAHA